MVAIDGVGEEASCVHDEPDRVADETQYHHGSFRTGYGASASECCSEDVEQD